jgi:hypothetical protein
MITRGRRPVVWRVADDREVTRIEGVFGDAEVTGITASGTGITASVLTETAGRGSSLDLWTSVDGQTWSRSGPPIPAPTCAQIVTSGRSTLAAGRPCDADVGWQAWLRPADGEWNRID